MQRRTFLQATAATSALAWQPLSAQTAPKQRVKVGQIGTKHAHASGQIATCRQLSDLFEVVGVVEPDEARRKRMQDQRAYRDVNWLTESELLNTSGLQVVAVETEIKDLLPTAQRCIDAGKHIHLDKPAGESFTDLQRLHAAAKKRSLTIQMGYMYRYNPAFQFLFQAVRKGWLGNVFEIDAVMSKTVDEPTRAELAEYAGGL